MSAPTIESKLQDPSRPRSPYPQEKRALYAGDHALRDTSAVFNVLDALEPAPGKHRLLRRGIMVLAGVFLIAAVGLIASRYVTEPKLLLDASAEKVAAKGTADKEQGGVLVDDAYGAQPEAFALSAATFAAQMRPSSVDAARKSLADQPSGTHLQLSAAVNESATVFAPSNSHGNAGTVARGQERKLQKGSEPKSATPSSRSAAWNVGKGNVSTGTRSRNPRAPQIGKDTKKLVAARQAIKPDKHKRKRRDDDVDLIAALLSRSSSKPIHANASEMAAQARTDAELRMRDPQPGFAVAATAPDIVIRMRGDSTESLVKRCTALGLIEGHLCRARICSGLWGKDSACPMASTAGVH